MLQVAINEDDNFVAEIRVCFFIIYIYIYIVILLLLFYFYIIVII